jgi:hypothetical protein
MSFHGLSSSQPPPNVRPNSPKFPFSLHLAMLLLLGDFLFDGGVLFPSNLAKRDAFGKSESLLEVSRERRIIVLSQQVLHIRHAHDSREQLCHGWRRGSGFLEASNTLPAMAEAIATSEHNLCLVVGLPEHMKNVLPVSLGQRAP